MLLLGLPASTTNGMNAQQMQPPIVSLPPSYISKSYPIPSVTNSQTRQNRSWRLSTVTPLGSFVSPFTPTSHNETASLFAVAVSRPIQDHDELNPSSSSEIGCHSCAGRRW